MAACGIVAAVVAGEQWLHHMNSGSRHSGSRHTWGKTYGWQVAICSVEFNVLSMVVNK